MSTPTTPTTHTTPMADSELQKLEQRVTEHPDDAEAWRSYADELVSIGDEEQAVRALRRSLDIGPEHTATLSDLAHLEHRAGRSAEAVELLGRALDTSPGNTGLLRNLIDLHLGKGQNESALARAEELAAIDRTDELVLIDIADIALAMGDHTKATRTFERLRRVDAADGHARYALHGVIEAEVLAQRWRPALNAAIDATAVDRHEFTTDLLLFVAAQIFGVTDEAREPKPWSELEAQLTRERAEHRRYHIEQSIL